MDELQDSVRKAISDATDQYYRLVILAGKPGCGKSCVLHAISGAEGFPLINVNLELSKRLLELTRVQRSRQVQRLLKDIIASASGEVVLLDNLEILFDPSLEVEPLGLLQDLCRNRTVVATWNGTYVDNTLTYAEPSHPEYLQFKQPQAIVLAANNSETTNRETTAL